MYLRFWGHFKIDTGGEFEICLSVSGEHDDKGRSTAFTWEFATSIDLEMTPTCSLALACTSAINSSTGSPLVKCLLLSGQSQFSAGISLSTSRCVEHFGHPPWKSSH